MIKFEYIYDIYFKVNLFNKDISTYRTFEDVLQNINISIINLPENKC